MKDRAGAIADVHTSANALGWHYWGVTSSPISGPAGNVEYLLWLRDYRPTGDRDMTDKLPDILKAIAADPSQNHHLGIADTAD